MECVLTHAIANGLNRTVDTDSSACGMNVIIEFWMSMRDRGLRLALAG